MSIFKNLKASLTETVEIEKGRKEPSKTCRFEVADVKAIRAKLNVSQAEFAEALGTSLDTVKSWESKRRNPTGISAKVLDTIEDNPQVYYEIASH